jgi:PAT family beta-lactamase induction signal transducer AmpG
MSRSQAAPVGATPIRRRPTAGQVLRDLSQPRVMVMLALGFSSGLPFLLTAGTFGYWLRDAGTSLKAIGFLSWVGFAYSFQFLWSPVVDRVDVPLLGRWLGRRRGWMLLTQGVTAAALLGMALTTPAAGLLTVGALALVAAFASSTQDIAINAWRIESAQSSEELGLLSSAYQLGYRVALLASDSLILIVANHFGWPIGYGAMAALMGLGIAASLTAREPARADAVLQAKAAAAPLWTPRGFFDAVVGPFVAFFAAYGPTALILLLFISLYRLPEYMMGPMVAPFYHDLGLSKDVVGTVRGTFGLVGSFAGIAVGGLVMARLGPIKGLALGGVLQGLAIAAFALLAVYGGDPRLFAAVMTGDNFGVAVAGVALVTYMSTLTSLGYTASQYALLSSTYAMLGKFLKGFSGAMIEWLQAHGHSRMDSYALFFIGAGALGLPSLLALAWLARAQRRGLSSSSDGAQR